MNSKKEGVYFSQMVRKYMEEYGGKNLHDFCIKEKVSYPKMLHCLRTWRLMSQGESWQCCVGIMVLIIIGITELQ